MTFVKC